MDSLSLWAVRTAGGYKGRVGIYEVMKITDPISRIIMAGGSTPLRLPMRHAKKALTICVPRP